MKMFVARNRLAVTVSALGFLALISAFVATGFAYVESEQQKQIAAQEANTASQAVDFLAAILGSANPWMTDQKDTTVEDVLTRARTSLEEGAIDNPAARSYVESSLAMAHDGRGEYPQALAYAESAVGFLDVAGTTGSRVAHALYVLGLIQGHADKTAESAATLKKAISHNPLKTTEEKWLLVEIETALGATYEARAEEDAALEIYTQALARAAALPEPKTEPLVVLQNNLGRLLHKFGRFDEAIGHYNNSLALSAISGNNLRRAITYSNVAGVYGDKKEWPQAIELLQKSLVIHSQANTLTSPDGIITRTSLANIQRRVGDINAAKETIDAAHEASQQTLGEEHFITAYVQSVAAITYCDSANWQTGLDYAKRSLATREKILPPTHWTLHSSRSVLGACETRTGNFVAAEALLTNAYQKLAELRGADGTQTLITKERLDDLARARAAQ